MVGVLSHAASGELPVTPEVLVPAALVVAALRVRLRRDRTLLIVGALALFLVVVPPIHELAERSVTGHMVQHLVMLAVVAPCLGLVLARAPSRLRGRPTARRAMRIGVTHPSSPVLAGTAHVAVVGLWHAPGPYDVTLASWLVHGVGHFTMVGSGVWWWATVHHHTDRRVPGAATVSLFLVATAGAVVGVLMMFAPGRLYVHGTLEDQQAAGALMAGVMGLALGVAALQQGIRALERLATPARTRVPSLDRAPGADREAPAAEPEEAPSRRVAAADRGGASPRAAAALLVAAVVVLTALGVAGRSDDEAEALGTAAITTAAVAAVVTQTDEDSLGGAASDPAADTDLGRLLYGRDCASCHGPTGEGSFRGPALTEVGTASIAYVLETGRMPIDDPDATPRRTTPTYDAADIDALVAFLEPLTDGPERWVPDLRGASIPRGGEHYRLHCAACHGAEGIGGALALSRASPPVLDATAADVAHAVVVGPGAMPSFAATFDDQDLADLAAYVEYLKEPQTTGYSVRGGRVGEGLVGWVVGVAVLVAGAFWLGKRA